MKIFQRIKLILFHVFKSRNTFGFGVHSPFLFHFTKFVLNERHHYYDFGKIEHLRKFLESKNELVPAQDFGTGQQQNQTIANIVHYSLSSQKTSRLLYRIISTYKFVNVLELGTSLGINTAYLASASSQVKCVTIEGNKHLAKLADSHLKYLGILNTTIVSENIDDCLSQVLQKFDTLDLVFFDANHRSTPLINYFNQCVSKINKNSIFVVDDVYWSDDMHYGWNLIKKHPAVSSSICTQRFGLLFFNNDLAKNHFHMIF